jgi:hypothetical protein
LERNTNSEIYTLASLKSIQKEGWKVSEIKDKIQLRNSLGDGRAISPDGGSAGISAGRGHGAATSALATKTRREAPPAG